MKRNRREKKQTRTAILFLLPSILVLTAFLVVPILYGLRISLQNYNMTMPASTRVFVGLKNYMSVLGSDGFRNAFIWTAEFVAVAVTGTVLMAMLLASLLSSRFMKGSWGKLVKTVFILPMMLCPLIVSNVWYIIFAPNYGLVNVVLARLGLESISFFGTEFWAKLAIIITEFWWGTPYVMIILMAALTTVPEELYEAAELDGAGRWQRFWYLTLPSIRNFIVLVISIRLMDALRMFDIAYALTEGGPRRLTQTLAFYIYETGFKNMKVGEASAAAFCLFLMIAVLTFVFYRVTGKMNANNDEDGYR